MVIVSTTVIRFGAASDAQELLALHDEMRQAANAHSEPLRQAVGTIARCHATTHDQPCLVGLRLFEDERPSGLMLTAGQPPGKNQAAFGLSLRNDEHVFSSRQCGKYTPHMDILIVRSVYVRRCGGHRCQ